MRILVLGGTRFFGKHLVRVLLSHGHDVTLATRGQTPDEYGDSVRRVRVDRTLPGALQDVLGGQRYDVICDNIAYCSNDVRRLLDATRCGRYVLTSSAAVYQSHGSIAEADFDPLAVPVTWGDRAAFAYGEGKRQAERALRQAYPDQPAAAARFPYVLGPDDYTRRLTFYVEHILRGQPIDSDDWDVPMAFVRADEAGAFLAHLAESDFAGAVNGASEQTASLRQISDYVWQKTGKRAVLSDTGDPAPYNGEQPYSINVERARSIGFTFTPLREWLFALLDDLIRAARG